MAPSGGQCTGGPLAPGCAMSPESQFGFALDNSDEDTAGGYVSVPEEAVEQALGAVDDILWAEPNSNDWDDEQWSLYDQRKASLVTACESVARSLR